jgi:hypothetical protein
MTLPIGLKRYAVDRDRGVTSAGITEVVVLRLTDAEGREYAFVLSKVDARLLGSQLGLAALDAQKT